MVLRWSLRRTAAVGDASKKQAWSCVGRSGGRLLFHGCGVMAVVLSWLPCKLLFGKPIFAQVLPGGVRLLDQCDFLGAGPAFELLFAGDSGVWATELLEPDQTITVVGG